MIFNNLAKLLNVIKLLSIDLIKCKKERQYKQGESKRTNFQKYWKLISNR